MCLALYVPKGKFLDPIDVEIAWYSNPDGGGFAYAKDGKINIFKSLDLEEFKDALYKVMGEEDLMIHFRLGTSGRVDLENCHPFLLDNEEVAFCHNGVIRRFDVDKSPFSDTVLFKKNVLDHLPPDFMNNEGILELIAGYIENSRIIFMNRNGNVVIVNERYGEWDDGIWHSNHLLTRGYKYKKSKSKGGKKGSSKPIDSGWDQWIDSFDAGGLTDWYPNPEPGADDSWILLEKFRSPEDGEIYYVDEYGHLWKESDDPVKDDGYNVCVLCGGNLDKEVAFVSDDLLCAVCGSHILIMDPEDED